MGKLRKWPALLPCLAIGVGAGTASDVMVEDPVSLVGSTG